MSEVQRKDLTTYTDFLPLQFRESPNIKKLLSIFLAQAQELEDANMDLDANSTDISIAVGYQLDIIGKHYPASVILETNGTTIPSNVPNTLDNMTMAGVSVGGVIAVPVSGQVFRGCSENEAFSNYEDITAPYPELELGGDNVECGSLVAECSIISFKGFTPVQDSSLLARCILPSIGDLYEPTINGAGELVMACGEIEAACSSEYTNPITTKGVFAGIHTKI